MRRIRMVIAKAERPGWAARAGLLAMLALTLACGGSAPPTSPSAPPPSALSALVCPAPLSLTTVDTSAPATYEKPTAQGGVPPIAVTCTPESGQPFPLGSTDIRCTATDQAGQTASCTFAVTVSRLPTFANDHHDRVIFLIYLKISGVTNLEDRVIKS